MKKILLLTLMLFLVLEMVSAADDCSGNLAQDDNPILEGETLHLVATDTFSDSNYITWFITSPIYPSLNDAFFQSPFTNGAGCDVDFTPLRADTYNISLATCYGATTSSCSQWTGNQGSCLAHSQADRGGCAFNTGNGQCTGNPSCGNLNALLCGDFGCSIIMESNLFSVQVDDVLETAGFGHQCFVVDTTSCGDIYSYGELAVYDSMSAYSVFVYGLVYAYDEITVGSTVSLRETLAELPDTTVTGTLFANGLSLSNGAVIINPSDVVTVDDSLKVNGVLYGDDAGILNVGSNTEIGELYDEKDLTVSGETRLHDLEYLSNTVYVFDVAYAGSQGYSTCSCDIGGLLECCGPGGCVAGEDYFYPDETDVNNYCEDFSQGDYFVFERQTEVIQVNANLQVGGSIDVQDGIVLGGEYRDQWNSFDAIGIENLLRNPGFEFGEIYWVPTGDAQARISSEESLHGDYSAKLATAADYWDSAPISLSLQEETAFSASGYYHITSGSVSISILNDDTEAVISTSTGSTTGSWERFYTSHTFTPGTHNIRLRLSLNNNGNTYFDDMQLETGAMVNRYRPRFLDMSGDAEFANLDAMGNIYTDGYISVDGGGYIGGNLVVDAEALVQGNLDVENDAFVEGNVLVTEVDSRIMGAVNLGRACDSASPRMYEEGGDFIIDIGIPGTCIIGAACYDGGDCISGCCGNGYTCVTCAAS